MATTSIPCPIPGCVFKTEDLDVAIVSELTTIHPMNATPDPIPAARFMF